MRNELIEKISAVHDELISLDVRPEYIDFARTNDEQLEQELEAVSEQLNRRKKFLEINDEPEMEIVVKSDQSKQRKNFFENLCG